MKIDKVIEFKKAVLYLNSRKLEKQYKKVKTYLLEGHLGGIDFKLRQPKEKGIYQFKITKKYRAFGYFEDFTFIIFKISDHQDS